jgi:hypothetical protein
MVQISFMLGEVPTVAICAVTFLVHVFAKCICNSQLRCILVRIAGDELRR